MANLIEKMDGKSLWIVFNDQRGKLNFSNIIGDSATLKLAAAAASLVEDDAKTTLKEEQPEHAGQDLVRAALDNADLALSHSGFELQRVLKRVCDADVLEIAGALVNYFTSDALKRFVLENRELANIRTSYNEHTTPKAITRLVQRLLDIKADDSVLDLCCGTGSFLTYVGERTQCKSLEGYEINSRCAALAQVRTILAGREAHIEEKDVLENPPHTTFDKVFANFPLNLRLETHHPTYGTYAAGVIGLPTASKFINTDWVFSFAAFEHLNYNGTAVAIIPAGSANGIGDVNPRKYFVENGFVKAVIALPKNLYSTTSIACDLLVLGRNDGDIRMVDATDQYLEGRRWDSMGPAEITETIKRYHEDGPLSRMVTPEEIAELDYNLHPTRYLGQHIEIVNATPFKDVIAGFERGAAYNAKQLDELTTQEKTGISYLRLSDISDGVISSDLPHLTELDPKFERSCLKTGDLVISKNGAPFKIAVADVPEGEKVLANGNLYIIRLDTSKVDPYFVAAFLMSDDGKELMNREVVGTGIPNLPRRNLERISIPVPELAKQYEVSNYYKATLDEVEVLRIKLGKARLGLKEAYAEVMSN